MTQNVKWMSKYNIKIKIDIFVHTRPESLHWTNMSKLGPYCFKNHPVGVGLIFKMLSNVSSIEFKSILVSSQYWYSQQETHCQSLKGIGSQNVYRPDIISLEKNVKFIKPQLQQDLSHFCKTRALKSNVIMYMR